MITKIFLLSCFIFGNSYMLVGTDEEAPIVVTNYGSVMGTTMTSRGGRSFLAFKGIPYAKPPIGELRFKAPEELESWTDILDATQDAPFCIQQNYLFSKEPEIEGSEDCLYMNIYSPLSNTDLLLPVMVAFHYGAFMAGGSASDLLGPDFLMDRDVILVTFNYRVGIFGFFSTYDDAAPGNWAFKDQVAVLKWVQDNVAEFGGNRDKVTIFGASAGAGSIHHHILSPQSRGLFHAAITQSGSALALWAQPQRELALTVAKLQADVVGCNSTADTVEIVNCLRLISAEDLVASMNAFRFMRSEPLTVYPPTIEFQTESNPYPFIMKDPLDIIENREFSNVPWIIGVASSEGILRAARHCSCPGFNYSCVSLLYERRLKTLVRQTDLLETLNANFNEYLVEMLYLRMSVSDDELPSTWSRIKEFYFLNNDNINVADPESIQGLINIYSDRGFLYPTYQMSLLHKHKGHENVWFYYFDYKGNQSYGELFAATDNQVNFDWGVSHCDDLLYLFKSPQLFPNFSLSNSDLEMSDLMLNFFTNFATYYDPTPATFFDDKDRWQPLVNTSGNDVMQNSDLRYLKIMGNYDDNNTRENIRLSMAEEFHPDRMTFWIDLPLRENIENLT